MPAKLMSESVYFESISRKRFVSGHDFSRAAKAANDEGFTGCGKTKFFEGDGLQAVRK
jgi:hypothetical protein